MARVISVNVSTEKGTIKHPINSGKLIKNFGIENDAHGGNWHRQISLLAQESINKMIALGGVGLTPGKFAENITTEGIVLHTLAIGTHLKIGDAIIEVTQIGKECHEHCEIYQQIGKCIMPTEGIFAKVIKEDDIKRDDRIMIINEVRLAIIVASDKAYRGEREDLVVSTLCNLLKGKATIVKTIILPDERAILADIMRKLADEDNIDIIITSGGTGLSPRDVTPEATMDVIDRLAPGIPEVIRAYSMQYTQRAMLSRGVAGIRNKTLIINLPGSPKAVEESMNCIIPVMDHIAETLKGNAYECAK